MQEKLKEYQSIGDGTMTADVIRDREEYSEQYRALKELKQLAAAMVMIFQDQLQMQKKLFNGYTLVILAAIKEQNGAAMSLGRTSTFLDIYIERDLQNGTLTEVRSSRNS